MRNIQTAKTIPQPVAVIANTRLQKCRHSYDHIINPPDSSSHSETSINLPATEFCSEERAWARLPNSLRRRGAYLQNGQKLVAARWRLRITKNDSVHLHEFGVPTAQYAVGKILSGVLSPYLFLQSNEHAHALKCTDRLLQLLLQSFHSRTSGTFVMNFTTLLSEGHASIWPEGSSSRRKAAMSSAASRPLWCRLWGWVVSELISVSVGESAYGMLDMD